MQLSPEAEALLASRPRPIVLASALAKLPDVARAIGGGQGVIQAARRLCNAQGLDTVVLSGGVFQNQLLLREIGTLLDVSPGLTVWTNRHVPPTTAASAWYRPPCKPSPWSGGLKAAPPAQRAAAGYPSCTPLRCVYASTRKTSLPAFSLASMRRWASATSRQS